MANFLDSLHAAFHLRNTRIYRIVQGTIGVVILLSVGLLLAEPIAPPEYEAALLTADRILLAFFALEVIIRIATVRPPELQVFHRAPFGVVRAHVRARIKHMLEPLVLVDIITVLALFPALRGLRAIRLLRLVRSIRVFRYTNPFAAISHNLEQDRLLFTFAFGFLGVQVIVGGLSIFLVERGYNPDFDSIGDGMWWAIVTITTVGFGDITPTTILGRVVAGVLMVGGMFTLALFAGIVGHSLLKAVLSIRKEQFRMSDIVNHVVVCGYTVGSNMLLSVLRREIELGETPVVIFSNSERPPEVGAEFYWVEGDPTKESELEKANMSQASAVVIAGSRSVTPQVADAVTLLTLFTIRSYLRPFAKLRNKPLYIIAEVLDSENVQHARAAGADEVIETRMVGYSLLAHAVTYHGTADTLSRVVTRGAHNIYVGKIPLELEEPSTFREVMRELRLADKGVMVIGVRNGQGSEQLNPPSDYRMTSDTVLIYLAQRRVLETP